MKDTFAGANIKGTPSMKAPSVMHDMRLLMNIAGVFVVQEFKWKWYWRVAGALMTTLWGSFPSTKDGLGNPIKGAQAIFWERKTWKKLRTFSYPAFEFSEPNAGIMDNRWIRAVLLKNKKGLFTSWFLTTHFVVGGDELGDGPQRKKFMQQNIDRLDYVLDRLQNTGYPICGELDANIHKGTWAYAEFMSMMHKHGATFHGDKGVEFSFTINGRHGTYSNVIPSVIPTSKLKTDHEVRVLNFTGIPRDRDGRKIT